MELSLLLVKAALILMASLYASDPGDFKQAGMIKTNHFVIHIELFVIEEVLYNRKYGKFDMA